MDKLELDLNDLEVNSFKTAPEQKDKQGTVQGNADVSADDCTYTETDIKTDWKECHPSEHHTACCSEVHNCETQNNCTIAMTRGGCDLGL